MKYDAFISYRHTQPDMYVAKRVHKILETYKIPANVRKKLGKKKINRVFRDQEELPIGSDLGDNIEKALSESEFLIVICSPRTKGSEWVLKEIETFISMHGREHVLAVLVEGEPIDSFPEQLLVDEDGNNVEPLAADVRGENKFQMEKKLKTECIRLVASIIGCNYDDLKQRHRERRMKKFFAIAISVAAFAIAFGIYASYNLAKINENYQAKLINESKTLAATSLDVLEAGDRKTATLIALEGLPKNGERPLVPESIYALAKSLNTYEIGNALTHDKVLEHKLAVDNMYLSDDGSHLVSSDNMSNVYYWDVSAGKQLFLAEASYYDGKAEAISAVYCDDEGVYVTSDKSFTAYELDGSQRYKVEFSEDSLGKAQFNAEQGYAFISDRENAYIYDLKTGKQKKHIAVEEGKHFSSVKKVAQDGKLAMLEAESEDGEVEYMSFINFETDEIKYVTLDNDTVLDLCFTPDGYAVVCDMNLFSDMNASEMSVEKFDLNTGANIWQKNLPYLKNGIDMTWTDVKARIYEDAAGEEHSELFVSGCTVVYGLNLEDGTLFTELHETANIEHFAISAGSSLGYILRADGTMDICDFTKGSIYSDISIKITEGMTLDFEIKKGILVCKGYLSNEIIVMSYMMGEGIKTVDTLDNNIDDVICAPDESTYLVLERSGGDFSYDYNYRIYSTDNDELLDSFSFGEESYNKPVYLDNNRFAIFLAGNTFKVYDISKKKIKEFKPYDDNMSISGYFINGDTLLCVRGANFYVYNLTNMKCKAIENVGNVGDKAKVTADGKNIFFTDYQCNLYQLDVKSGKCKQIVDDYLVKAFSINPEGTQLAIACSDGMLRYYDISTKSVKDAIDFYVSSSSCIMEYTKDGKYLLLHGSDYHFKVLEIATNEIVFITDQQINSVTYTSYDPTNSVLAIKNAEVLYLIDTNSWGILQYAPRGKAYLPQNQSIFSVDAKNLYKFKYQTYEDLLKLANKKYKGEKLSKIQKLKYNIQ